MFTNVLLHPHHIIPAAELVATLHEAANQTIAQVTVELDAVFRLEWVCASWGRDAGIRLACPQDCIPVVFDVIRIVPDLFNHAFFVPCRWALFLTFMHIQRYEKIRTSTTLLC